MPLSQTSTPYQIYDAIFDVTRASQGWDTKVVKESLNVLSETVDQTSPHLTAALEGVQKLSETIGSAYELPAEKIAEVARALDRLRHYGE